jgi:hypothetical protein
LPFNLKLILKAIRTAPVPYTDLPYSMFYLAAIREGNALLYLYVRGNSGGTGGGRGDIPYISEIDRGGKGGDIF